MNDTVEKALNLWGLQSASYHLIAARENQVFRVDHEANTYALRLHRAGYRSDAELWSELQWIGEISRSGLCVPTPVASITGNYLQICDGIQVDVLTWLPGAPMGKTGEALQTADREGLFRNIGRQMAQLHEISDRWTPPEGFTRVSWNRQGLLGEAPVWGQFWDNPTLSPEDRELFLKIRNVADKELACLEHSLDFGLIHADLVRENVMVDDNTIYFIDFDDAGFGFRLFDLATTLLKNMNEEDYPELKSALIEGYKDVRSIDTGSLELFILLRSATYAGWIVTRMDEDGSKLRNARFVEQTRMLAQDYLTDRQVDFDA